MNKFMEKDLVGIIVGGGPAPGINGVIGAATIDAINHGKKVVGIVGGFKSLFEGNKEAIIPLTIERVSRIHTAGGSILRTSRDKPDNAQSKFKHLLNTLKQSGIKYLITIGGDGTLYMANWIEREARGLISIVHTPKTIDNDILYVYKTFGFDTAVQAAREVLTAAHNEAEGAPNGVGLVKLMGRDSGFIACHATLASMVVNFCLIPEAPFVLDGPGGLLELLEKRLARRDHAVIAVAEGAGLDLVESGEILRDKSGNIAYSQMSKDIGAFLRDRIKEHFKGRGREVNVKYIDPSYVIRSVPAEAGDALFCNDLGRAAVHAAMAGKTDMVVGLWHNVLTHVPLAVVTRGKKKVPLESSLWNSVLSATGQPGKIGAETR